MGESVLEELNQHIDAAAIGYLKNIGMNAKSGSSFNLEKIFYFFSTYLV